MDPDNGTDTRIRFGTFELDLATGGLRRGGVPVRLPAQPAAVLRMLLLNAGSIVTREDIGRLLWHDRWQEFEPGINTCISQIRGALGDDAGSPSYIETVPRRGYRFVAPTERLAPEAAFDVGRRGTGANTADARVAGIPPGSEAVEPRRNARVRRGRWPIAAAAILALGAFGALATAFRDGAAAPAAPRTMLAVMPFENMDADGALEYVGAGLTEELTTLLASVDPERLGVIARTSSAALGSGRTIAEIGRALGVEYVVEGGIRSGSDRVRITAQLIRVADQSHIWAETFDRAIVDVLDVQRDVARRVTGALALTLVPEPAGLAGTGPEPTVSPARLPTLEATFLLDRAAAGDLDRAFSLLDSALAADSAWAPVWAARARALAARNTGDPRDVEEIRSAARRAIALDDAQIGAHLQLAAILYVRDWDWQGAEFEYRRALALGDGRADVHHAYALFLAALGRSAEAAREIELAMRLDPVSTLVLGDAALVHYFSRDYDRAEAAANRVLGLDPDNLSAHSLLVNVGAARGSTDETLARAAELSRLVRPAAPAAGSGPAGPAGAQTVEGFWRSWIGWWRANSTGPILAYQTAIGLARVGQPDSAIAMLASAFRPGQGGLTFMGAEPAFDSLRNDPRFTAMLNRMGLAQPEAVR